MSLYYVKTVSKLYPKFSQSIHLIPRRYFSDKLISGKKIASQIKEEIKTQIDDASKIGFRSPQLTVVLVGNNPASLTYIKNKLTAAKYVGINTNLVKFNDHIKEAELLETIQSLNHDQNVDGILIQLPLPPHMNETRVCQCVDPKKDVDGFHFVNAGQMFLDIDDALMPCTACGVIELIKRYNIETFGKKAVVCGRSKNVGLPIAIMLQADRKKTKWGLDATVTICNRYTPKDVLEEYTRTADIIITAVGKPKLITASMVKKGVNILDVGISRIKTEGGNVEIVGDVDFKEVSKVANLITPVPGGVGPMTIAMLMQNTLYAAIKNRCINAKEAISQSK